MIPLTHVYFAHRLSGPKRLENIEAVGRLMADVTARIPIVPVGSWVILTRYWDESKRSIGLDLDLAQIARCDEFWLTGPEISPGMSIESACANEIDVPSYDYVGLTAEEIVERWLSRRGTGRLE